MNLPLGNFGKDFLRYGNRSSMYPTWSEPKMSDRDHYSGYPYAAIQVRANSVARVGMNHIHTQAKDEGLIHPYLELVRQSRNFTEMQFWYTISTYLDLEGVFYLLALRNYNDNRIGDVVEFKLLNPYRIKRIVNQETFEVGGYVESRNGMQREFDPRQIIEIRKLNPFDEDEPFAMTDASKESQFTLKTAGDYSRNALRNNINAPGILTTDVLMEQEKFKNFVERVKNHLKGEPLFGNGAGAIKWTNMESDLQKAALKDVNEINRDLLISTSGMSKTTLGIEQSGVTRETSKVQTELMMLNHILPQTMLIVDALNMDYRLRYPEKFKQTGANIIVDNPVGSDYDAEAKEVEVRESKLDLYQKMLSDGYPQDIAAKYANGEMGILEIGEPKNLGNDDGGGEDDPDDGADNKATTLPENVQHVHNKLPDLELIKNQESMLRNAIVNIEEGLVVAAINRVPKKVKNGITEESDVITKTEKNEAKDELILVLAAFYGVVFSNYGPQVLKDRESEFGLESSFVFDKGIRATIKTLSGKVAESHIETVAKDIYETARQAALEGLGQREIVARIKERYGTTILQTRAATIARTESNRAFTMAQFEADSQFVKTNDLEKRAFKQWVTRSDNPCPYCIELSQEGPIPFFKNFRNLGDSVTADGKSLDVNFTALEAGNAHPNCQCIYELVIK